MKTQGLRFIWDPAKDAQNRKRHNVSFEEAASAFLDERALLIADPDHSEKEDRFVLLGMSARLRIIVACHCYREREETIRIISARRANRKERGQYEERWLP